MLREAASRVAGATRGDGETGQTGNREKLLVDETEAATVRLIFQRYLDLGSLPALQRDLRERGLLTRSRLLALGRIIGGVPLSNGPLSHPLKNRMYLGEINHKGASYRSDHPAIVGIELFDAMQARLAQDLNRCDLRKGRTGALLTGRIVDDRGNPMSPSHTTKKGVRYRYYVSTAVVQGRSHEAVAVKRLAAHEVETLIMAALGRSLPQDATPDGTSDARASDQKVRSGFRRKLMRHMGLEHRTGSAIRSDALEMFDPGL